MEEIGRISSVERQKKQQARVSVHVDGQFLGSVEDIVWMKSGLKTGDVLPAALWEDMRGRQEAAAALDKAVRRLAARARGRAELEKYLAEKGFSAEAVGSAIEKLQEYGYLDDEAFAGMYVRDRMSLKPVGKRQLAIELKRMGIGEEDSAAALAQVDKDDELAAAMKQAEKDLKRTAGETDIRKRKAKVYAGLARRGFSADAIDAAVKRLFSGDSEDGPNEA